jgi:peptidyl-prolyl cis-trans isomerase D
MLKVLRDNLKYLSWVLWLVIAVFILFVFVDFGATVPGGTAASDTAVTVGGHEISFGEFERSYRQIESTYRQLYGEQFNSETARQLGLPLQVLDGLVTDKILLTEAKRLGLQLTDAELQREILAIDAFKDVDGNFIGAEAYQNLLRRNGLTVEGFERSLREDLLTEKVRSLLAANVFVSDQEVEEAYRRRSEQANIRFVYLPWDSLDDEDLEISPEELDAYFEANREAFRIPERRSAEYLLVDRQLLQQEVSIADAEARSYYDDNLAEFTSEEQVRARHILMQVGDSRSPEEARRQLEEARRRLAAGETFEALAEELSEDPGSKSRGGDLGFFGRGQMVPPFEQAAFDAEVGTIVGPVETDFGQHLIEILEKRAGGTTPFEEAAPVIRSRLARSRATEMAESKAAEIATRLADADDIDSAALEQIAAEEIGVTLLETEPFGRDDNVPGIGRSTQFSVTAFGLQPGEVSQAVPVAQGWTILRLAAIEQPRLPELDEVRDEVEAALRREQRKRRAVDQLAAAALKVADGGSLDGAAAALDLEVEESGSFGRDGAVGSLGRRPKLASAALEREQGDFGGPVELEDGAVVFEVVERQHFDPQEFSSARDSTREALEAQRVNELLTALIEERRRSMDIRYDTQLLANFDLEPGATGS